MPLKNLLLNLEQNKHKCYLDESFMELSTLAEGYNGGEAYDKE